MGLFLYCQTTTMRSSCALFIVVAVRLPGLDLYQNLCSPAESGIHIIVKAALSGRINVTVLCSLRCKQTVDVVLVGCS